MVTEVKKMVAIQLVYETYRIQEDMDTLIQKLCHFTYRMCIYKIQQPWEIMEPNAIRYKGTTVIPSIDTYCLSACKNIQSYFPKLKSSNNLLFLFPLQPFKFLFSFFAWFEFGVIISFLLKLCYFYTYLLTSHLITIKNLLS